MLGQRLETSLKSQTLPRLDGQDEEGEVLENQFEILSIVNSCPDLSVLEIETIRNNDLGRNSGSGDVVDGIGFKNLIASVTSGSFRRSTSLSSLGVECVDGNHHDHDNNNGPVGNILQVGRVNKVAGQLEKTLKKEGANQLISTDFIRTGLRASHGGTTGYLHKSISSPSVTQYFVGAVGGHNENNYQKSQVRVQSDAHQHSSKRSFFRRKHKSKSNLVNSHPPTVPRNRMDGMSERRVMNGDNITNSLAFAALCDPSLGLQDFDAECWALSMSPDLVSRLEDKEVKRQEHMYELILTEKHHCLTLALMQHLFVRDMKKSGFSRYARLLFPELNKLLEVHFVFLRRMRERQQKFRELEQPLDTLSDILVEQFTTEQYHLMIRFYGLLCASHTKSLDIFRTLMKDPKFASLVATWDKETLLGRKNVRECLLLVAQRITKYPLLIEPILKTSLNASLQEKELIVKALRCSKDLISKVDQRVADRQSLLEFYNRIDPKSFVTMGQRRRYRDDIISLPSRRLLFQGQVIVNGNKGSTVGGSAPVSRNIPCNLTILTDSLIFTQELNLKYQFVSPPGIVMLNNLIVRENAGQNSSLFLVLDAGASKPEMVDFKVVNPPDRKTWLDAIRNAITKCVEETETGSDVDEEVDAADLSDLKTTKALEELQEQDKQLLSTLRSRARLIDSLRVEKPFHWLPNRFEGKESILNSLSSTCSEVQRTLSLWEDNANNAVIRSASCAGDNGAQAALLGLSKRADTFGGFDSQQRFALELPQCTNSRLLMEMVIHLSQLCGEMFSQMIPQLLPSVYQTHHQLQRRMEDLREAQQRLETEKALFQQELASRKESIDREKAELNNLKLTLQKEQEDITQQREQLYRKLEALQKQGIRPPMDPISPLSVTASVEKPPTNPVPTRRPLPQSTTPTSSAPANSQPANGLKSKQQLPLFLASTSSFKAGKIGEVAQPPPSIPMRNPAMSSFKGSSSGVNVSQSTYPISHDPTRQSVKGSTVAARAASTQQVQQMLPLRLSEGNANKTASLPRGVGSRSVSSMLNQIEQQQQQSPNSNQQMRNSASAAAFPYSQLPPMSSNSSFLYGPVSGRSQDSGGMIHRNGHNDNLISPDGISVVHRRSGSSPVPMSSVPQRRVPPPEIQYHQHQHPFFHRQRDDDSEKILFL